jgi:hypothetical protein
LLPSKKSSLFPLNFFIFSLYLSIPLLLTKKAVGNFNKRWKGPQLRFLSNSYHSCLDPPSSTAFLRVKNGNELIKTSNLYTTPVLRDEERLIKAASLFNNNNQIGKLVRHLHIHALDLDSDLILSLPKLLPHTTKLIWEDVYKKCLKARSCPPKESLCQAFKKWKRLEYIEDSTKYLNLSTRILEYCKLDNLKHVTISYENVYTGGPNFKIQRHSKLKEL